MAKELNFSSGWGVDFPKSYWKISHISIDAINQLVRVQILAYKDKAAADTNKDPISSKSYDFKGIDFLDWYEKIVSRDSNPFEWAYNKLGEVKDTLRTKITPEVVVEKDGDGKDVEITRNVEREVIESFFENAADV